ncbi:hypothetical protein Tco_0929726 [Tanacetum coccineum]
MSCLMVKNLIFGSAFLIVILRVEDYAGSSFSSWSVELVDTVDDSCILFPSVMFVEVELTIVRSVIFVNLVTGSIGINGLVADFIGFLDGFCLRMRIAYIDLDEVDHPAETPISSIDSYDLLCAHSGTICFDPGSLPRYRKLDL